MVILPVWVVLVIGAAKAPMVAMDSTIATVRHSAKSRAIVDFIVFIGFLHPANVLFTRHDSKTKSILKLNQKKVGYLKNNPHHALLTTLATKPQGFATESALLTALNTGKIKAAILTDYQYNQLLAANPLLVTAQDETDQKQVGQVLTKISDPKLTSQSLVVASFKKPRLQKKINHKLKQLQDNGTLSKLSMKYFHQDWTYQ